MNEQGKPAERERRDWAIILIILLFGFLCVILAGEQASRFSQTWKLDTNMRSNLDPDSDFLTNKPAYFYEPIDPAILTQQIRINNLLTPGALFEILPSIPGVTLIGTPTSVPTLVYSPTAINPTSITPNPTNTLIYFPPPPPTNTPKTQPAPTNTPLPIADLAITKTDTISSYIAGGTVTYTITVVNNGPKAVTGAFVKDTFDITRLSNITWACAYTGGASSTCAGSGNINDAVNLPNGATVIYTVSANISGSAMGNLVNTASVSVPTGYTDPTPSNNSSTDTDTLTTTSADLSITKDDGSTTYTPGGSITYTIVVSNPSASTTDVTGATVTDTFDTTRLNTITWTCSASVGASCTASGSVNISDAVDLPIGGTVTYTVSANINPGATGDLVNTATLTAPAGVYDPDTTNNSATDTDTAAPSADLWIEVTDNSTDYVANALKIYTIKVHNAGPSDVTGAIVSDVFSTNPNISGVTWGCLGTGGTTCTLIGIGSDINDTVTLPSGSSITYTVFAQVVSSPSGPLVNTASVTAPVGVTDPGPGLNSATDTDQLIVSSGTTYLNIGTVPDYVSTIIPEGGSVTLSFSSSISVDNTQPPDGFDLIYYELQNGTGIAMDQVLIEISDGNNWYPVIYWGNGAADTNSNLNINIIGGAEGDNRDFTSIPASNVLYPFNTGTLVNPATGVTIELENYVPNGTYYYIRITAMGPPAGDGAEVDAIYVVP